MKVNLLRIS